MAIQYSGNAGIYSFTTGSSTPATDAETALLSALASAGWSKTIVYASDVLTFTGNPANNSTFTLDAAPNAETYTFVTSLTSSNQILIGLTAAASISNAVAGLTGGAGAGTVYSSTFTKPPNMTASGTSTTLTVTYTAGTSGSYGDGAPVSVSGTINATWASSTLTGGLNFLLSAITAQGLQVGCQIYVNGGSFYNPGIALEILPCDRTQTRIAASTICNISASNATTVKIIANKFQFICFQPGATASNVFLNCVGVGVPYITSQFVAPKIVSATNASPISCNVPSHGFNNGDQVLIAGGTGNTAVNGIWTMATVDSNNFTLTGSTGNGTYTANSAQVSDIAIGNTIIEAIWSMGVNGGAPSTIRNTGYTSLGGFLSINGSVSHGETTSTAALYYVSNVITGMNNIAQWYDNTFVIYEPFMAWGINVNAAEKIIGQMYDGVIVGTALTLDQTASFDSPAHSWWTVGLGNNHSILFATT